MHKIHSSTVLLSRGDLIDRPSCFLRHIRRWLDHSVSRHAPLARYVPSRSPKLANHHRRVQRRMVKPLAAALPWERILSRSRRFNVRVYLFSSKWDLSASAPTDPLWRRRLTGLLALTTFEGVESLLVIIAGIATERDCLPSCQLG